MSKKWTVVSSNALELWNPIHITSDPFLKKKLYWEKRKKDFNVGLKIRHMKTEKPKRKNKGNSEENNEME